MRQIIGVDDIIYTGFIVMRKRENVESSIKVNLSF